MTATEMTTDLHGESTVSTDRKIEIALFAIAALLIAVAAALTTLFGPVGLAMTALAMVPVCYFMILWITVGK